VKYIFTGHQFFAINSRREDWD